MPFMDGLALSRIVKKTLPWIKIIIISGHDEFEYAREAISIGVEEYLLKPVSAQEMLATLEKVAKQIDEEKKELLSLAGLKTQIHSTQDKLQDEKNVFDPADLLNIDGNIFFTKLKYAAKKDIDPIVREYTAMLGNNWIENPILVYFLFSEIIISVSKIVEALGGDIKKIIPFSLKRENINRIISSVDEFTEKVTLLLSSMIEFRDSNTKSRFQTIIVKAREYIDNNFANTGISLFSTAAHVGISPNHLSAVFVQETGENYVEYLTRVRIDKAKQLLRDTKMKNADIAYEIGFSDPHYFSNIFKKNTGFSPKHFRSQKT
jgi:two-component system response regulator YesN